MSFESGSEPSGELMSYAVPYATTSRVFSWSFVAAVALVASDTKIPESMIETRDVSRHGIIKVKNFKVGFISSRFYVFWNKKIDARNSARAR